MIDIVLVDLADVDGSLTMNAKERRQLISLVGHMAGRPPSALAGFHDALGLRRPSDAADAPRGPHAQVSQDEEREYSTREVLDRLENLGVFEIIMGMDDEGKRLRAKRAERAERRRGASPGAADELDQSVREWRPSWREREMPKALRDHRASMYPPASPPAAALTRQMTGHV